MIFVLRVGQLHIGLRTTRSGWHTVQSLSKFHVLQTLGWYLLSAWVFAEVYIWSAPKSADLHRIKYSPKNDRPSLNEKPVYLTSFLLILAVVQTGWHLYFDYDQIDTQVKKNLKKPSSQDNAHAVDPAFSQMKARLPKLCTSSATRAAIAAMIGPFVYSIRIFPILVPSIRVIAWSVSRHLAKAWAWTMPKATNPPSIAPFHYQVLLRTFWSGFLLIFLWEVGNAAFSVYVSQEPLKNDRPITYESRDPNGSLLTGLKGKKLQTRVSGSITHGLTRY